MTVSNNVETEILGALSKYMEAYQKRDIDGFMSNYVPDDDQVHFGTGADEKRIGRDGMRTQAERDWAQTESLTFDLTWHQIKAVGSVAWIAAEGLGQGQAGGQAFAFPLRMTAVVEKRGGEWLLAHSHLSLPAAVQEEGDSVPV